MWYHADLLRALHQARLAKATPAPRRRQEAGKSTRSAVVALRPAPVR